MRKTLIFSSILMLLTYSCTEPDPNNGINARVMVWRFVESRLKDPGSADFGLCKMEKTVNGGWETDCYVDAKNGFGGGERLYFHCEVKHKYGDSWELIELTFN